MSNSISTPNLIVIEMETTKLGEGFRILVPRTIANPLANISCNDIMIHANKLANDLFVGLRVAINDVHRSWP